MFLEDIRKSKGPGAKLAAFKSALATNETYWDAEVERLEARELIYRGDGIIKRCTEADEGDSYAYHVRNIAQEMIEAQIDNNIPYPKVTAVRKQDEDKAKLIEEYLRNVIDFLPFEEINDNAERICKINGGVFYLVEYDEDKEGTGKYPISVRVIHPKWIVPQFGIFTSVEDMDYIFLKIPTTKERINRMYGADVDYVSEEEPEIKSVYPVDNGRDMVTQYYCYYKNGKGGIGLFSWVGKTVLCDMKDYQVRRLRVCAVCGRPLKEGEVCVCGSKKAVMADDETEKLTEDVKTRDGLVIPAARLNEDGAFERAEIPFYKPAMYPIIMQKNVSVFGQLLGLSEIDKIQDQQNTINRMEKAIIDRIINGGTYSTLPTDTEIEVDSQIGKVIRLESPADKSLIGTFDMQGDVAQHLNYMAEVYEEARQIAGVTDSYQGRKDPTAASGKAKEIMAQQAAERIESKKIMKTAAFANLYELIFKMSLAYFDEPMDITVHDAVGNTAADRFYRYDFLVEDKGGIRYNDAFLFSCDNTSALMANREGMWQEVSAQYSSGTLGDPALPETRVLYWTLMSELHYPMADVVKARIEEQMQAARQAQAQTQEQAQAVPPEGGEVSPEVMAAIDELARQNAEKEKGGNV